MKMTARFFAVPAALIAIVLAPGIASAHFIWATIQKNEARFALLESVDDSPSPKFEKYVTGLSPRSGGKSLTLGAPRDGARYGKLAPGQTVVVVDSIIGAKVREGVPAPYLLVYHAKGAVSLAAAGTDTKADAEITAHREDEQLVVSVRQKGKPAVGSDVWVLMPGDDEERTIKTDAKGEARVSWTKSTRHGLVGIRAMVAERKSGENDGAKYEAVHHWATLTFPGATPKAAQSATK